jgi:receptor protein-tyrosine kinase
MRNVINKLSRSFSDRVVIFDSPPILATSEARVLANLSGQIVMVVCAGVTPQQAVLDGIDSIGSSKAISLIFNQSVSGSGDSAYGRYGYGYGFDY